MFSSYLWPLFWHPKAEVRSPLDIYSPMWKSNRVPAWELVKKAWLKFFPLCTDHHFLSSFPISPLPLSDIIFFCVPGYWSTHWQSFMYLSPSAILRIQPPEFLEWTLWKFNKMYFMFKDFFQGERKILILLNKSFPRFEQSIKMCQDSSQWLFRP